MSHFLCCVILPKGSKIKEAEKICAKSLDPFHEFECTGLDNEYVKEIDETEEIKKEYSEDKSTYLISPNGEKISPYANQFYRELTAEESLLFKNEPFTNKIQVDNRDWGDGKGYRPKTRYIPDGYKKKEFFTKDVVSFLEFASDYTGYLAVHEEDLIDKLKTHKYGYILVDSNNNVIKCVKRTNPNRKWDWWVIGGRWTGTFINDDPTKNPKNYERCFICEGSGSRLDMTGVDWSRKGNEMFPCIGSGCNACYGSGMVLKHPPNFERSGDICPVAELKEDFTPFAFLTPEGEWIEKGQMGWFACVSNEKDKDEWKDSCRKILDKYKDCIAVAVDCHI